MDASETKLFDLSGRVAVVTGAASGLGQAMAIGLARQGAEIACVDVNDAGLAEPVAQIAALPRKAAASPCDISQAEQVERLFAEVDRVFGRVDVLINDPYTSA